MDSLMTPGPTSARIQEAEFAMNTFAYKAEFCRDFVTEEEVEAQRKLWSEIESWGTPPTSRFSRLMDKVLGI
jgi:hypothetical protein